MIAPLLWVFTAFQYFGEILPLVEAFDVLYKTRYILWVGALLGACDIMQDGGHIYRHLGLYQKLQKNGGNLKLLMLFM